MIGHKIKLAILFSVLFLLLASGPVRADSCEDQCKEAYPEDSKSREDCEDKCEDLNKKAKVYEGIIKLKDKQQDTLSSQLKVIDQEQSQNQSELYKVTGEISALEKKISELQRDIVDKESTIESQKKILAGLMRSYYEYDQQGILGIVVLDQDFSGFLSQYDYIGQSGTKASEVLSDIVDAKNVLMASSLELGEKKQKSDELKEKLSDKKYDLQKTESQKQTLLVQTQGEEEKYRDLLKRVEEQKKELFNFSEASNADELRDSVGKYPKPSKNLASTSWYFSQRDSRWANTRIGNSSSLMKDYGCAITCVSMVFRKNGSSTTPGKMAKEKIFYYDLIKWPSSWSPGISLASSISHGNVNWSTINSNISKGHPVIVFIKKTNGRGGHYVVITGKDDKDYIVHDPYFGANLYLGTSKSLVGKLGSDSGVKIDQMIIYK